MDIENKQVKTYDDYVRLVNSKNILEQRYQYVCDKLSKMPPKTYFRNRRGQSDDFLLNQMNQRKVLVFESQLLLNRIVKMKEMIDKVGAKMFPVLCEKVISLDDFGVFWIAEAFDSIMKTSEKKEDGKD